MKGGLGGQTDGGLYYILSSLAVAFEGLDSISESLARQVAVLVFQLGDRQAIIDYLRETLIDEEREELLTQRVEKDPQEALEGLLQLPGAEAALAALAPLLGPPAARELAGRTRRGRRPRIPKGGTRPLQECTALLRGKKPKGVADDVWAGCRRLVRLRLELGLNQLQFAALAGQHHTHYGALERGRLHPLRQLQGLRDNPWSDRAMAACEALGVQPEEVWKELAPPSLHVTWPTVGAWTERASRSIEYLEDLMELEPRWAALADRPRHERAIKVYYGMNDLGAATLDEVGAIEGLEVTRERVRQIIKRGLEHMREWGQPEPKPASPENVDTSLAATFHRLLEKPSVQRGIWIDLRKAGRGQAKHVEREKPPIHRQDVGYSEDKKKALAEVEVVVPRGLTLQAALLKLDKVWDLCRRRILGGMSGVIRSREEEELLRLAELRVGAAAPNPMTFSGVAEALIIFPYSSSYRPFPMGEDAWVDVYFLKIRAAEFGFATKAVPPFHIAFFWKGKGSCESS